MVKRRLEHARLWVGTPTPSPHADRLRLLRAGLSLHTWKQTHSAGACAIAAFAAPQAASLQDGDRLVFEAIARHGPLPTHYLYEFIGAGRSYLHFQHRLTELYNGDDGGSYLTRPPQQHAGYEARYQHLVYDLTPRARDTLGLFALGRGDPFLHRLMQACVGASMELACARRGLRYLDRDEILARAPEINAQGREPDGLAASRP